MHIIKTNLDNFSAAHRLVKGYVGKCQHLHGHDYSINVVFGAAKLNQYDFVIDFLDVKKYCNDWIQENWDHATLVCVEDKSLINFLQQEEQKYYVLANNRNTTVEALAEYLFNQLNNILQLNQKDLNYSAHLLQVEIWETKSSGAIYGHQQVTSHGEPCGKKST